MYGRSVPILQLVPSKPQCIPDVILSHNLPLPYTGSYRFALQRRIGMGTDAQALQNTDQNPENPSNCLLMEYQPVIALAENIKTRKNTPRIVSTPGLLIRIITNSSVYKFPTICVHKQGSMRIRRQHHVWASQAVENLIADLCRHVVSSAVDVRQMDQVPTLQNGGFVHQKSGRKQCRRHFHRWFKI